jgi:hypothetical protein
MSPRLLSSTIAIVTVIAIVAVPVAIDWALAPVLYLILLELGSFAVVVATIAAVAISLSSLQKPCPLSSAVAVVAIVVILVVVAVAVDIAIDTTRPSLVRSLESLRPPLSSYVVAIDVVLVSSPVLSSGSFPSLTLQRLPSSSGKLTVTVVVVMQARSPV